MELSSLSSVGLLDGLDIIVEGNAREDAFVNSVLLRKEKQKLYEAKITWKLHSDHDWRIDIEVSFIHYARGW